VELGMSITVVAIIACVVIYFLVIRNKKAHLHADNDILVKYKEFIDLSLEQGKTSRIERIKSNSINIRTSSHKSASVFSLTEVNGRTIIVWTWFNSGFGRRGKEWSFPANYSQKKMFDEVLEDVLSYQIATYQQHNEQVSSRL
jgi:hypothetical protein